MSPGLKVELWGQLDASSLHLFHPGNDNQIVNNLDATPLSFSIDIAGVASGRAQTLNVFAGALAGHPSCLLDDLMQGGIDVLGHARGVAADVEMRARLEPGARTRRRFPVMRCWT